MEINAILLPQTNKSISGPHTIHNLCCRAIVHRLDGHNRRCMDSRRLDNGAGNSCINNEWIGKLFTWIRPAREFVYRAVEIAAGITNVSGRQFPVDGGETQWNERYCARRYS